jgi:hypothetical protein
LGIKTGKRAAPDCQPASPPSKTTYKSYKPAPGELEVVSETFPNYISPDPKGQQIFMVTQEEWLTELSNINSILHLIRNSEVLEIAQNYIHYIQGKIC